MNKVYQMWDLAIKSHAGQVDKAGQPYIYHIDAVWNNLRDLVDDADDELIQIAIGHDLIEDTTVTSLELRVLGFSDRVVDGIVALTKLKSESYEDYKARVLSSKDASLVKLADLKHNMDLTRLPTLTQKDLDRVAKYHQFYKQIQLTFGLA